MIIHLCGTVLLLLRDTDTGVVYAEYPQTGEIQRCSTVLLTEPPTTGRLQLLSLCVHHRWQCIQPDTLGTRDTPTDFCHCQYKITQSQLQPNTG
ncbi:hypothetical protein PPACK8108_LOCUS9870 [Phakopsora pachyrhizi]|uniref:Secreted protein n=1 Tax=Phakopsora pachyrhizi TaxID=170000 RepID=A0AAV0AXY3_PHAPC|nr:hypothetical protein PPACK8108_LOCUS9870 [Phakopsora pachyrhizi]